MNEDKEHMVRQRFEGAQAIEELIRQLAKEQGLVLTSCAWNLNQGLEGTMSHRLDLFFENTAFKAYFLDDELVAFGGRHCDGMLLFRLRSLLAERHDEALPIPLSEALKRVSDDRTK